MKNTNEIFVEQFIFSLQFKYHIYSSLSSPVHMLYVIMMGSYFLNSFIFVFSVPSGDY